MASLRSHLRVTDQRLRAWQQPQLCCCSQPPHSRSPMPAAKTQLCVRHLAVPLSRRDPDKACPSSTPSTASGAATPRRAAASIGKDLTYSDRRALLSIPRGFDARRPAVIVVFLHGNLATLARDVRDRQQAAAASRGVRPQRRPGGAAIAGRRRRLKQWEFLAAGRIRKIPQRGGRKADRGCTATHARARRSSRRRSLSWPIAAATIRPPSRSRSAASTTAYAASCCSTGYSPKIDKFADWIARHPQAFFFTAYGKHAQRARRAATPAGRAAA